MGQKQFYQGHPISSPFVRNAKGTGPLLAKEEFNSVHNWKTENGPYCMMHLRLPPVIISSSVS